MPEQEKKTGRIACILASGFEDSEFRVPYNRLRQAGYLVEIIGASAGQILEGERKREKATTDFGIDEVEAGDYQGLLIPGGYSPDKLRAEDPFIDFVKAFDRSG